MRHQVGSSSAEHPVTPTDSLSQMSPCSFSLTDKHREEQGVLTMKIRGAHERDYTFPFFLAHDIKLVMAPLL